MTAGAPGDIVTIGNDHIGMIETMSMIEEAEDLLDHQDHRLVEVIEDGALGPDQVQVKGIEVVDIKNIEAHEINDR